MVAPSIGDFIERDSLKGGTTRYFCLILYFVFNSLKYIKSEFYKEHIGNVKFWPKTTIFEKITKNMFFATFCSK